MAPEDRAATAGGYLADHDAAQHCVSGLGATEACDVLIIGAGPAGLFAACELVRHGVTPRIVEMRKAPHREARGTAIQPATLELLHRAGVLERFLERGAPIRVIEALERAQGPDSDFRVIASSFLDDLGCPWPFQISLPQYHTEEILRAHLASHGVAVEFGVEVDAITPQDDGLLVSVRRDGAASVIRAAHVLGAGGAHSITRRSMAQPLQGATYDGAYVVADVRLDLACPTATGGIVLGPDGLALLSPLPEGRWLIFLNLPDDEARAAALPDAGLGGVAPSSAELAALLDARLGRPGGLSDLRWASCFRMHRRVAPRLSDRRRFLLGDAGHLSSPLGGEGVNAALMDAADIAWKLALVLGGEADPRLLDSYAVERGMADAHVLAVSDEIHDAVMGLIAAFAAGERPEVPPEPADVALAVARRRSMLDISLAGSPLIAAADDWPGPKPGERFAQRERLQGRAHHVLAFGPHAGLAAFADRWQGLVEVVDADAGGFDRAGLGLEPEAAALLLLRPDGFIGFAAAGQSLAALEAHLASYLIPARQPALA